LFKEKSRELEATISPALEHASTEAHVEKISSLVGAANKMEDRLSEAFSAARSASRSLDPANIKPDHVALAKKIEWTKKSVEPATNALVVAKCLKEATEEE